MAGRWLKEKFQPVVGRPAGVRGGQAIGKTDANGQEISGRPVSVEDLFQTVCKALHIEAGKELITPEGRPIKIVDSGMAVKELFA